MIDLDSGEAAVVDHAAEVAPAIGVAIRRPRHEREREEGQDDRCRHESGGSLTLELAVESRGGEIILGDIHLPRLQNALLLALAHSRILGCRRIGGHVDDRRRGSGRASRLERRDVDGLSGILATTVVDGAVVARHDGGVCPLAGDLVGPFFRLESKLLPLEPLLKLLHLLLPLGAEVRVGSRAGLGEERGCGVGLIGVGVALHHDDTDVVPAAPIVCEFDEELGRPLRVGLALEDVEDGSEVVPEHVGETVAAEHEHVTGAVGDRAVAAVHRPHPGDANEGVDLPLGLTPLDPCLVEHYPSLLRHILVALFLAHICRQFTVPVVIHDVGHRVQH